MGTMVLPGLPTVQQELPGLRHRSEPGIAAGRGDETRFAPTPGRLPWVPMSTPRRYIYPLLERGTYVAMQLASVNSGPARTEVER